MIESEHNRFTCTHAHTHTHTYVHTQYFTFLLTLYPISSPSYPIFSISVGMIESKNADHLRVVSSCGHM